VLSTLLIR